MNAGAQRSKEREAQLVRKDDVSPTMELNWGPLNSFKRGPNLEYIGAAIRQIDSTYLRRLSVN